VQSSSQIITTNKPTSSINTTATITIFPIAMVLLLFLTNPTIIMQHFNFYMINTVISTVLPNL